MWRVLPLLLHRLSFITPYQPPMRCSCTVREGTHLIMVWQYSRNTTLFISLPFLLSLPGRLSTGCVSLDAVLQGGLLVPGINEIAGMSAAGKTQLCLQLCLTVQLPLELGGLNGGECNSLDMILYILPSPPPSFLCMGRGRERGGQGGRREERREGRREGRGGERKEGGRGERREGERGREKGGGRDALCSWD